MDRQTTGHAIKATLDQLETSMKRKEVDREKRGSFGKFRVERLKQENRLVCSFGATAAQRMLYSRFLNSTHTDASLCHILWDCAQRDSYCLDIRV